MTVYLIIVELLINGLTERVFNEKNGYPVGAYASENSPYHNFFNWTGGQWPNNEHYSSWWDHPNHPKLNYEHSDELYTYIMNIARKWVSPPYNADGWRLDVAADLGLSKEFNMKFWRAFRKVVKMLILMLLLLLNTMATLRIGLWVTNGIL